MKSLPDETIQSLSNHSRLESYTYNEIIVKDSQLNHWLWFVTSVSFLMYTRARVFNEELLQFLGILLGNGSILLIVSIVCDYAWFYDNLDTNVLCKAVNTLDLETEI